MTQISDRADVISSEDAFQFTYTFERAASLLHASCVVRPAGPGLKAWEVAWRAVSVSGWTGSLMRFLTA